MTDQLVDAEWEFHTALRRTDDAAATEAASLAVRVLDQLAVLRPAGKALKCEQEVADAVQELISAEAAVWAQRAKGEAIPSVDEVDLFFSFFGAEKLWIALVHQTEGACGPPSA